MMSNSEVKLSSIPEYFKGKCIFITGASGFIGKVLIEKLLRSCPNLKSIYILLREKKGKSSQDRTKEIINLPLFEKIKKQDEGSLNKIIPIFGDIRQPDLGISEEDKTILISNVNVVYHCAASIRFNDHLKDAIFTNVRSTRDLINLTKKFKRLDVYVHVSTTFCHIDKQIIEEKIYPAPSDWRDAISIAESLHYNDNALEVMTLKFIHPFPNTYTYTKSLGEHVVEDLCKGSIPAVILRPSLVTASCSEPFPGWVDSFSGPSGIIVASLTGVYTHYYADKDIVMDCQCVDNVAKSLIAAVWKEAETKTNKCEVTVYNAAGDVGWKLRNFEKLSKKVIWDVPFTNRIWYGGNINGTRCWYYYYLRFIFVCLIPTLVLSGLFKLLGKQFLLLKLQRKIYIATTHIAYFFFNHWDFRKDKYEELDKNLLESDKGAFKFYNVSPKTSEDLYDYCKSCLQGTSKFLLHEKSATKETFRTTKRLYILDRAVKLIFYGLILYWIFWNCDILSFIIRYVSSL